MSYKEFFWRGLLCWAVATAISGSAYAQSEGQIAVGYSDREVTKSSDWGLPEAGELSAAIRIDPALLTRLSGVKVCGVSAGLASRLNVEEMKVWVRTSLEGENLAETSADARKGWNDLTFDAPCPVEGDECYVGYTLRLEDTSYPVSVVDGESEYGFYLNLGEGWVVPETATPSVLSLLAVIEADNLSKYDLSIEKAEIPGRMKIGSASPITLKFGNKGCRSVSGANIRFYENGEASPIYNVECALAPGEKGTAVVDYTPLGVTRGDALSLKIEIESLAEGPDDNPEDNVWSGEFNLCKYDFLKRVFIEEFTTRMCSNCPRAAEMLHELLALPGYGERIVMCARHSGFGTDVYTSDADLEMLEMYGGDGTYCPALMIDRTPFYSDGVPVTGVPGDLADLLTLVDRCLEKEASVDITATAAFDKESGKVRVKVSGGRDKEFGNTPARLSVYLVENDIFDSRQQGAEGDYFQQHVVRSLDSTWGIPVEWDADDEFTYECLLDPSKVEYTGNTEIVAVVHDYDPDSISNRLVNNAFSTKEIDWEGYEEMDGVDFIGAEDSDVEYFDLQGRRLAAPGEVKGIVVKRTISADKRVKTEKVII